MSFRLIGIEAMQRKLRQIAADMDSNRIPKALRMKGELVMTDSKQNFVPVHEGVLRSSGKVDKVIKSSKNVFTVRLSYGGAASAYAKAAHEHLSKHSPPSWKKAKVVRFHPDGRGPKYLERPLMNAVPGMAKCIAASLKL